MVSFEQSIVNWLVLGGLVAVLYSLRYLVVLERRLVSLENSMWKLLSKVEQEERDILLQEKLIGKKVLKKGSSSGRKASSKRRSSSRKRSSSGKR
ncbi:MAG: hypothetical protein ACLFO2_00105 [Candidatus Woesearchaeota archaeon]